MPVLHPTTMALNTTKPKHGGSLLRISLLIVAVVMICFQVFSTSNCGKPGNPQTKLVRHTVQYASYPSNLKFSNPPNSNTELALRESFGFFDDITDDDWKLRKLVSYNRPHHSLRRVDVEEAKSPNVWYQVNWEPDFSCTHEEMIGPLQDGHKWVCDPHRLERIHQRRVEQGQPGCLVYSIGSNGNFLFEQALLERAPFCEIHVFDPADYSELAKNASPNIHYHVAALKPGYTYKGDPKDLIMHETAVLLPGTMTLQEIMESLKHTGRVIDIFKVDCEGCEWSSYEDWLRPDVDLRQILMETHHTPLMAPKFFQDFHDAGYVMFHKEPNIQHAHGKAIEFSMLKLDISFQAL